MNEKEIKTIWRVPIYLPYLQPKLTEEMIEEAENKIGYPLPKEYVELLRIQNGGYIRFTLKDTPHSMISGIGPYYSSIMDFEWLNDYKDTLSYELDGLFPFDGDGHWNLALDYRRHKVEPEITYFDTESDYERTIAKNFKEYIQLLILETEGKYVIQTRETIEKTIYRISEITNISFKEPDFFAYGYPVYTSSYKNSFVWVSPNKVCKGFIRQEDKRYEELKSHMKATALRYPEISATDLFISVAEEAQQEELFTQLIQKGFKISALKDLLYI